MGHTVLDAQETQKAILPEYHTFLLLFLEGELWQLLPKGPGIDHKINLKPVFQPPFGLLYGL
jgi:hypothetical protein